MNYNFLVSSNITFGEGSLGKLHEMIKEANLKKIMLVHGSSVKAAGIADLVIKEIEKAGTPYVVYNNVIPNPTNEVVHEGADFAKNEEVDGFIAVGGGSCIDLAKAVNVLMTNPGSISDYAGIGNVKNPCLPLIAIPTTAGTSSEITNVSALIDTEKVIKYVVIDDKIIPSRVICDSRLTLSAPKGVTASTGMDAITHAVESYISNMATPLSEYNSLKSLEILFNNIKEATFNGSNMVARENMMLGCIIAGFGFSNANLGLVHAIAHTLSAHFGLAHGMANASVLPYVMEFNAISCPEKMIKMAEALDLKTSGNIESDMYLIAEALKELVKDLGIKTLSEQGISKDDFPMLAEEVLKEVPLIFNPRQGVTKEDVIELLEKAY